MEKPFPVFKSKVIHNEDYDKNVQSMKSLLDILDNKLKSSLFEGSEQSIKRHKSEGKLLARERINLILDEDSPFLELMPLAGDNEKGISTGASCVCGIGLVK